MRKVHTDIFVLAPASVATLADGDTSDASIAASLPFPDAASAPASPSDAVALAEPVQEIRPGYAMHFVDGDLPTLHAALLDVLSQTMGVRNAATHATLHALPISHEALYAVMQGDILRFSLCQDTISLQLSLTPFTDADGRLAGVILMSQPCDDAKATGSGSGGQQTDAPVPHAQTMTLHPGESAVERMRRELLAIVSHELRSPLSSIRSWTHVLRQSLEASHLPPAALPQADRALAGITAGVERQVEMVDTLIDAARVLAGDVHLRYATFRLGDTVEATLRTLAPELEKKQLTVERIVIAPRADADAGGEGAGVQAAEQETVTAFTAPDRRRGVPASLPDWQTVTGDVERVTQIVSQLLGNAIKFSTAGGVIRVRVQTAQRPQREVADPDAGRSIARLPDVPGGAFVALSVEDDGVGIAPALLPGIFRTFAQVDQSTTRRSDGFGLGLPVARQLAELHGGELLAQSEGESHGARFTLTLPTLGEHRAAAARHVAPTQAFPSLAGIAVMVIDDQQEVRESLTAVLEQSGAEVLAAESGRDAIAQLEARGPQHEPDILICDIAMPDEDGYVTLLRIRQWEENRGVEPQERLAAIAVTAFAQREDRDRALSRGYALHFSKPVDPTRLLGAVAALAGK
ncbi:hybrid sensor histidine kinase/response regulator [Robbsia sp. Bb-Pol-6]|uniref:histidine kinase n=1 Tax=Robbsia betulipollinis TaxID=2981849 RepID=A0ABT3ZNC8_9BURK|nr:hybrid sensor histidine kinase/response regulator [Robbsia betulipollinis]MCY0388056.1 hybrid sensor histidine kinase/response regulator [Robbsia betulipollinis]